MRKNHKRIPWYFLPFWWIWKLVSGIVAFTGRLVAVVLGFVFMIVGVIISATLIGLIIGIPLILLGVLLVIRGLF
jgi:hypothetical protein